MKKKKKMLAELVVVWVVLCMQAAAQGGMVEGKTAHVTITNRLPQQLRVHCESREDDLGRHELGPNGTYPISFTPNIFGTTAFWCDFDSDVLGKRRAFPVWFGWLQRSRHPDLCSCWDCDWFVTPSGFSCHDVYYYSWHP